MSEVVASRGRRSKYDLISRIKLIDGDITKQGDVDAIVASITQDLRVEGGLNQAIMAAAGERLDTFMMENIYKPRAGDAVVLPAFNMPMKHIIYVLAPARHKGFEYVDRDLLRLYRHAMQMAHRMELKSIAFPAFGTGKGQYPVDRAARLALQGITERQLGQLEEIRIVCNQRKTHDAFHKRLNKIKK